MTMSAAIMTKDDNAGILSLEITEPDHMGGKAAEVVLNQK